MGETAQHYSCAVAHSRYVARWPDLGDRTEGCAGSEGCCGRPPLADVKARKRMTKSSQRPGGMTHRVDDGPCRICVTGPGRCRAPKTVRLIVLGEADSLMTTADRAFSRLPFAPHQTPLPKAPRRLFFDHRYMLLENPCFRLCELVANDSAAKRVPPRSCLREPQSRGQRRETPDIARPAKYQVRSDSGGRIRSSTVAVVSLANLRQHIEFSPSTTPMASPGFQWTHAGLTRP